MELPKISVLEKLPDSALTTVHNGEVTTETAAGAQPSATSNPSADLNNAALQGAEHTKITTLTADSNTAVPAGNAVPVSSLVEAKLAVELMDSLLPSLLVAGMQYFLKVKVLKSKLQLTEKEKNVIAPLMEKCMASLFLNFNNPWAAMGVTLAFIYGGKVTETGIVTYLDKQAENKAATPVKQAVVVPINTQQQTVVANADFMQTPVEKTQAEQESKLLEMQGITEQEIDYWRKKNKKTRAGAIALIKRKKGIK